MGLISQEKRAHAHAHYPATLTGTTHWQEKHGRYDKKTVSEFGQLARNPYLCIRIKPRWRNR